MCIRHTIYNQQLITGALLSLQNCGQFAFVQHAVSDINISYTICINSYTCICTSITTRSYTQ